MKYDLPRWMRHVTLGIVVASVASTGCSSTGWKMPSPSKMFSWGKKPSETAVAGSGPSALTYPESPASKQTPSAIASAAVKPPATPGATTAPTNIPSYASSAPRPGAAPYTAPTAGPTASYTPPSAGPPPQRTAMQPDLTTHSAKRVRLPVWLMLEFQRDRPERRAFQLPLLPLQVEHPEPQPAWLPPIHSPTPDRLCRVCRPTKSTVEQPGDRLRLVLPA